MRRTIVAGNWKMHKTPSEFQAFNKEFSQKMETLENRNSVVIIFPPFLYLEEQSRFSGHYPGYFSGAQDCHHDDEGAYTGEVSPAMISEAGCRYVIIGHSERRIHFGETNETTHLKVQAALRNNLTPVLCCGETLAQREAGMEKEIVGSQIRDALVQGLTGDQIVIAYEPVWAIGTGKSASKEEAREMHTFIRNELKSILTETEAEHVSILYGGSVKPENAQELFQCTDIDGALIGGASLDPEKFFSIILEMEKVAEVSPEK